MRTVNLGLRKLYKKDGALERTVLCTIDYGGSTALCDQKKIRDYMKKKTGENNVKKMHNQAFNVVVYDFDEAHLEDLHNAPSECPGLQGALQKYVKVWSIPPAPEKPRYWGAVIRTFLEKPTPAVQTAYDTMW